MDKSTIVYLELTSYRGTVPWAEHYYAKLYCDGHEKVNLSTVLSAAEAREFRRKEPDYHWRAGDTTSRFSSKEEAIELALRDWKTHFPDARVLILGFATYAEPQRILAGVAPETQEAMDAIFQQCENLGWWDDGNDDAVEGLCDDWFEMLEAVT